MVDCHHFDFAEHIHHCAPSHMHVCEKKKGREGRERERGGGSGKEEGREREREGGVGRKRGERERERGGGGKEGGRERNRERDVPLIHIILFMLHVCS